MSYKSLVSSHRSKIARVRGFTLIELMVSISIIVLVSAMVFTRQSSFNGAVLLRNQAYEVAFAIRQAQQLAVSGGDQDVRRYGVCFTKDSSTYQLFKDEDSDGVCDATEYIGVPGKLDGRFEVRTLMAVTPTGDRISDAFSVVFERPNFDAKIYYERSNGTIAHNAGWTGYVDVARAAAEAGSNGTGDVRRVRIAPTGQISVVTY